MKAPTFKQYIDQRYAEFNCLEVTKAAYTRDMLPYLEYDYVNYLIKRIKSGSTIDYRLARRYLHPACAVELYRYCSHQLGTGKFWTGNKLFTELFR